MKLLVLALSLLVGFASTANAGIFVEPYLGYGLGSYKFDTTGGDKGKITGPVLGGRIGGEMAMLFIGGDYSMSLSNKMKSDAGGTDPDVTSSQLFGVIGANLPIIRLWAGYGLMNELKEDTVVGDITYSGGSHIKVGVGLKVIPMLSLNAEYIMSDYKKAELGPLTGDPELKVNTVLLSASVPFSF